MEVDLRRIRGDGQGVAIGRRRRLQAPGRVVRGAQVDPRLEPRRIDFGRYHALVIGNNGYQHLRNLTTAVGDADAVAKLLEEKYGFQVTKLTNATRRDIAGALNRLRQTLTERDNLLVYYAGHGVLDEEAGAGYWQPVDARSDDDTDWFSNIRLTNYPKAMSAQHVMVSGTAASQAPFTRPS
jgi:hypothetical protein